MTHDICICVGYVVTVYCIMRVAIRAFGAHLYAEPVYPDALAVGCEHEWHYDGDHKIVDTYNNRTRFVTEASCTKCGVPHWFDHEVYGCK